MSGINITSYKEFLTKGRTVTDFTIDGKCSNCGGCCTNLIPMTRAEFLAIKGHIEKFKIKPCKRPCFPFRKVMVDLTCPFRDEEERICTIYKVRPTVCQVFMCNFSNTEIFSHSLEMLRNAKYYQLIPVKQAFFEEKGE